MEAESQPIALTAYHNKVTNKFLETTSITITSMHYYDIQKKNDNAGFKVIVMRWQPKNIIITFIQDVL